MMCENLAWLVYFCVFNGLLTCTNIRVNITKDIAVNTHIDSIKTALNFYELQNSVILSM